MVNSDNSTWTPEHQRVFEEWQAGTREARRMLEDIYQLAQKNPTGREARILSGADLEVLSNLALHFLPLYQNEALLPLAIELFDPVWRWIEGDDDVVNMIDQGWSRWNSATYEYRNYPCEKMPKGLPTPDGCAHCIHETVYRALSSFKYLSSIKDGGREGAAGLFSFLTNHAGCCAVAYATTPVFDHYVALGRYQDWINNIINKWLILLDSGQPIRVGRPNEFRPMVIA